MFPASPGRGKLPCKGDDDGSVHYTRSSSGVSSAGGQNSGGTRTESGGEVVDPVLFTLAILATMVACGLLVFYGWAEVRARRAAAQPAEPPTREAIAHVGNALAATHDTSGLLPVILDATVEATGAAGGRVLDDGRELARVGEAVGGEPIQLDLGASTTGGEIQLLVNPPEGGFSPESSALAEWLASQASIAL